jgi:hypothetical protein
MLTCSLKASETSFLRTGYIITRSNLKTTILFRYSLFHKMTMAELKRVKKYLINNLDKGFIKAS